eukprot:scaffold51410_cov36-Prasinocladus_malaysianus.AAC.6
MLVHGPLVCIACCVAANTCPGSDDAEHDGQDQHHRHGHDHPHRGSLAGRRGRWQCWLRNGVWKAAKERGGAGTWRANRLSHLHNEEVSRLIHFAQGRQAPDYGSDDNNWLEHLVVNPGTVLVAFRPGVRQLHIQRNLEDEGSVQLGPTRNSSQAKPQYPAYQLHVQAADKSQITKHFYRLEEGGFAHAKQDVGAFPCERQGLRQVVWHGDTGQTACRDHSVLQEASFAPRAARCIVAGCNGEKVPCKLDCIAPLSEQN